jgi:hypothetical protein
MLPLNGGNDWSLLNNATLLLGDSEGPPRTQTLVHSSLNLLNFGPLIFFPMHKPWPLSEAITNDLSKSTRPTRGVNLITLLLADPTRPTSFGRPGGHRWCPWKGLAGPRKERDNKQYKFQVETGEWKKESIIITQT